MTTEGLARCRAVMQCDAVCDRAVRNCVAACYAGSYGEIPCAAKGRAARRWQPAHSHWQAATTAEAQLGEGERAGGRC